MLCLQHEATLALIPSTVREDHDAKLARPVEYTVFGLEWHLTRLAVSVDQSYECENTRVRREISLDVAPKIAGTGSPLIHAALLLEVIWSAFQAALSVRQCVALVIAVTGPWISLVIQSVAAVGAWSLTDRMSTGCSLVASKRQSFAPSLNISSSLFRDDDCRVQASADHRLLQLTICRRSVSPHTLARMAA